MTTLAIPSGCIGIESQHSAPDPRTAWLCCNYAIRHKHLIFFSFHPHRPCFTEPTVRRAVEAFSTRLPIGAGGCAGSRSAKSEYTATGANTLNGIVAATNRIPALGTCRRDGQCRDPCDYGKRSSTKNFICTIPSLSIFKHDVERARPAHAASCLASFGQSCRIETRDMTAVNAGAT